jgi:hypothetical protein
MDRWYRCIRCGHVGSRPALDEGQPGAPVCACCGSYEIEACAAPADGRAVPLRALLSAETQALRWKKQAELLSALVNRAASAGALETNYVTEARMIQAGMI